MARPKQSQKNAEPENILDLGKSLGLTLMTESTSSHVDDWLPTLMPALDHVLGGGIPFGRVTEIFGKEQSGKSTLAVHLTKMAALAKVPVIWIDVEGTADPDNLKQLGVPEDAMIWYVQPKEGEQLTIEFVTEKVKSIAETFGSAGRPVLIIWDSLASTATEQHLKEGYNPNQMGVVAKAIQNMTVQVGQKINQNNIAFVILNQARDDLKANPLYPQIKSTGGRAMEHWGSVRLECAKASQLKDKVVDPANGSVSEEYIGHIFRVKTRKSKVTTPNRKAEVYLISEPYKGFDFAENVYRSAVDHYGLISKGAWREYVTDAGVSIKLRDKAWVPYLESEEGLPVLRELFQKELLSYFPEGFAPLNNVNVDVAEFEFLQGMKEYYAANKNKPEALDMTGMPVVDPQILVDTMAAMIEE